MSLFHFVDRIHDLKSGEYAFGTKLVTRNEGFYYWLPTGQRVLSPAVVTEALAQLGAWLKMYTVDFTKRPVLLADELTSYHGWVEAGQTISLQVRILDIDDDVVVSQSQAQVDGKTVIFTRTCRGYMLPMEQFDDRANVIRHFNAIYRQDEPVRGLPAKNVTLNLDGESEYRRHDALRFMDGLLDHVPFQKVVGFKNFSACEPYFATHFPYKPVVPGVLLLTFMGEVCQFLIKESLDSHQRTHLLIPTFIRNVRFRKFVEPGDQCILYAEVVDGTANLDNQDIVVKAHVIANDRRVMQAEMGFRTMFGKDSQALQRELPYAI